MESEFKSITATLKSVITEFFVPLQRSGIVDEPSFEHLHATVIQVVRMCKGQEVLPKALLREIQTVYLMLRAEGHEASNPIKDRLHDMADKVEFCFSLILRDEIPEDRVPGVPRFV